MIRILLADPLAVARKGLRHMLLEAFPLAVMEEVNNPADILSEAQQRAWDLVISDIVMPGYYGLEILHTLHREYPQIPVLILSKHPEHQYAKRILKAGVKGYLCRQAPPNELITAVRSILEGKKYITPRVAEKIVHDLLVESARLPHEALSDREFDVFRLLAGGKKISEIAAMFSLSATMIGNYRNRIFEKMNVENTAELIVYATRHSLT